MIYHTTVRLYLVLSLLFFLAGGINFTNGLDLTELSNELRNEATYPASGTSPAQAEQQAGKATSTELDCERLQQYDGPWRARLAPALKASCYKVLEDSGRTLTSQIGNNLPRALFVFLPLLALFMKLLYWRPRRYYIEHLLFLVHDTSTVFLLLTLSWLAQKLVSSTVTNNIDIVIWIYLIFYLYRSMRQV